MSQYEQYRDSGVDWIGDVPAHWGVERTKYRFQIAKRQVPHAGQEILSITQSGIRPKNVAENEGQMAQNYDGYQEVHVGDFAMNSMDLLTGWVDLSKHEGLTSPDYRVFTPLDARSINPTYFKYVFQLLYMRKIYYKFGQGVSNLGRWRLQRPAFLNFPLPVPSLREQQLIVCHLDTATAEIDDLKAKLAEQRTLLERYKRELIAETVRRGLDPNVQMKDSGFGWIGIVPAHWMTGRNKHVMQKRTETVGERWGDFTLLSLGKPGVTARDVESGKGKFPASFETYQAVQPGDLVLCLFDMDETPRTVGLSSLYGMVTGAYDVFSVSDDADRRYLYYWFLALDNAKAWKLFYKSLRKTITPPSFLRQPVPLPPLNEQEAIADFIDSKSEEINILMADIDRQVELLNTYRKQLISDVVTGKIRVSEDAS